MVLNLLNHYLNIIIISIFFNVYLFVWLCGILTAAHRTLHLHCGMQDLHLNS